MTTIELLTHLIKKHLPHHHTLTITNTNTIVIYHRVGMGQTQIETLDPTTIRIANFPSHPGQEITTAHLTPTHPEFLQQLHQHLPRKTLNPDP